MGGMYEAETQQKAAGQMACGFFERIFRPVSGSQVQEPLGVPIAAQNEDRLIGPEAVGGAGEGLQVAVVLGGQHVDVVFLADRQLHDGLAHPGGGHRRLEDGVVVRQLDVVEDVVGAVPHRRPVGHLLLRVDHVIRAVAQQELGVDIPGRPGQHEGGALLLQQSGSLQRALEVIPNGHHA